MNKMKFMLYAFIALFATVTVSCSDDDDNNRFENLPIAVQQAFNNKYPGSRVDSWKKKNVYYVIDFRRSNVEAEAWFNGNVWKMTETDIVYDSIPKAVSESFKKTSYADWKIDDVDMVERNELPTMYVIEVEKGKSEVSLYYFEDGKLFKEIVENDNNSNPYIPEIPSAITDSLASMYPGAVVYDIEFEKGNYEVEIRHENIEKEIVFDKNFKWLYSKHDVTENELPKAVSDCILQNYPGYKIDEAEYVISADGKSYYEVELVKDGIEKDVKITEKGEILK